jgi:CTP:molybdopterin cytidylyltransferase MocA
MPSNIASTTQKVTKQVPNKRERAAAQYGQIDVAVPADWNSPLPTSIKAALDQLAARVKALEP